MGSWPEYQVLPFSLDLLIGILLDKVKYIKSYLSKFKKVLLYLYQLCSLNHVFWFKKINNILICLCSRYTASQGMLGLQNILQKNKKKTLTKWCAKQYFQIEIRRDRVFFFFSKYIGMDERCDDVSGLTPKPPVQEKC